MHAELGIVPEILIKFYVLRIALILDYLHAQNVIYRSLNFTNVLIDNKGYPNIFDFKNAKRLHGSNNFRTTTLIGTPHYCAP